MTPQEKAKELVEKFTRSHWNMTSRPEIIKCALICVEELIIEAHTEYTNDESYDRNNYWQSVKQELLNIK